MFATTQTAYRRPMFRVVRAGLSSVLALLALGFAVLAIATPAIQREEQARHVARLRLFEKAAGFATAYHRRTDAYPTEERIGAALVGDD